MKTWSSLGWNLLKEIIQVIRWVKFGTLVAPVAGCKILVKVLKPGRVSVLYSVKQGSGSTETIVVK